jgi:hypothetical protein
MARFKITPTTAAVTPDNATVNRLLPRSDFFDDAMRQLLKWGCEVWEHFRAVNAALFFPAQRAEIVESTRRKILYWPND